MNKQFAIIWGILFFSCVVHPAWNYPITSQVRDASTIAYVVAFFGYATLREHLVPKTISPITFSDWVCGSTAAYCGARTATNFVTGDPNVVDPIMMLGLCAYGIGLQCKKRDRDAGDSRV